MNVGLNPGGGLNPGMSTRIDSTSRVFLRNNTDFTLQGLQLDKDVQDVGNTPVTQLRGGLVLVRVEGAGPNQGQYVHATHADAPAAGSIVNAAILSVDVDTLEDGVVVDKPGQGVVGGFVNEDQVIFGTADGPTIAAMKAALNNVDFRIRLP